MKKCWDNFTLSLSFPSRLCYKKRHEFFLLLFLGNFIDMVLRTSTSQSPLLNNSPCSNMDAPASILICTTEKGTSPQVLCTMLEAWSLPMSLHGCWCVYTCGDEHTCSPVCNFTWACSLVCVHQWVWRFLEAPGMHLPICEDDCLSLCGSRNLPRCDFGS